MIYGGTLTHTTECAAPTRVVAVADHRVLAAAVVGGDGRWMIETDVEPTRIVAQHRQTAVAAAAAAPTAVTHLELPELVNLDLEQEGSGINVTVWLDPIDLVGFPRDLLWSLFGQPDSVVDLHVAELNLPPGGERVTIPLQRGRFRLSGGTISLRPGFGPDPIRLAGVTEVPTGNRIESHNGQVIIDICDSTRYLLHFEKVSFTAGIVATEQQFSF